MFSPTIRNTCPNAGTPSNAAGGAAREPTAPNASHTAISADTAIVIRLVRCENGLRLITRSLSSPFDTRVPPRSWQGPSAREPAPNTLRRAGHSVGAAARRDAEADGAVRNGHFDVHDLAPPGQLTALPSWLGKRTFAQASTSRLVGTTGERRSLGLRRHSSARWVPRQGLPPSARQAPAPVGIYFDGSSRASWHAGAGPPPSPRVDSHGQAQRQGQPARDAECGARRPRTGRSSGG